MWNAYLFQVTTGKLGPRIELESATWSVSLNETETFSVEVLKSSLPVTDPLWFTPWWGGILLMYKDIPVVAGPILSFPQETRTKLKMDAKGIRRVLAERILVQELVDWKLLPTTAWTYSGMGLGTIAKRVVEHGQGKPGGRLPITYVMPDELYGDAPKIPNGLPACAVPDGSSGPNPCYWNADAQAGGVGPSYAILGDQIVYASQNNHERTYRGFNVSNINIDQVLTKLSEVSRGPDIIFRPRLAEPTRLTFDMLTGTETDPHIRQESTPIWDTTAEQGSVTDISLTQTAAYQASRVFSTGAGSDESTLMAVATNTAPLERGFPLLEKVITSDTETQAVVTQQAQNALYSNEGSLQEITMTVRADGDIPMGQFWPGDRVQIVIKGMMNIPDGIHNARLLNMSGTLSTNIRLALQLEK